MCAGVCLCVCEQAGSLKRHKGMKTIEAVQSARTTAALYVCLTAEPEHVCERAHGAAVFYTTVFVFQTSISSVNNTMRWGCKRCLASAFLRHDI